MNTLSNYLAVGIAGFFGAIARFGLTLFCDTWLGPGFPVGTMIINLSGSFFLAWFYTAASQRLTISETTRIAIGVGFVGAYTTFSTWAYNSVVLFRDGAALKAAFNLIGSMVLGLAAAWAGIALATR